MKKYKIITLFGTRPEIIRLSSIIKDFDKKFNHIMINTMQNYDTNLNKIFFKDLNLRKPNYEIKIKEKNAIQFISSVLIEADKIFLKEKPDAVFILGDTNSALAAISAKRNKIPIFHYEAGNRSFDQRVPEEINRKVVDHLSDINLTYSEESRNNLIRENVDPNKIFNVGNPLPEVYENNKEKVINSDIMNSLSLTKNQFFLVSFHRQENLEDLKIINNFCNFLLHLVKKYKLKVIFSVHPRALEKFKRIKSIKKSTLIKLLKPLSYTDYLNLQISAKLVFSDSGTINEEADLLNFKAINVRENHERHEAMTKGSTIMSGLNLDDLIRCTEFMINEKNYFQNYNPVQDYKFNKVSQNISRIVVSYINNVNRNTWKKN
ncbi:UDP-N-acetylglucosamine 2-epimerase (non-hydrolyzing) [Candidatus Pelagibacter sp.]|nr:UDP-N-acetylglucosamine 2-epimerase (non-hydrolyzing) [Candidatus Pelagibacter sp.]